MKINSEEKNRVLLLILYFHRYRNPRSHLVLPEWSRLSLILPNVCTMRAHTYKIKRYFAYRRRLYEDGNVTKTLDEPVSVQV